ncbi:MAG: zinc ABC transporter substrate-binding protein [Acidobacteria bacterium]|nr:zinc ABC transporter substrate-binding protein [Acidobacteriota bacterium]
MRYFLSLVVLVLVLAATATTAATTARAVRAVPAAATLRVVATTEDLASLAREVGGDKVTVDAIAKGYQDPHFVEAKPSFILKFSRADLLLIVGRELEIGWLPSLINNSRNSKIQVGASGYLDASADVKILDIPTGQITRAMGDVHPSGNPHYWLDPGNGRIMARSIRDRLTQLDRANAAYYAQRYDDFDTRLAAAELRWDAMMAPHHGSKMVTYHRSWPNFVDRFRLDVIGYVEPKPGVPPSPSHTLTLIEEMKSQDVMIIAIEPYFDSKTPKQIGGQTGAEVLVLAPSVGGVPGTDDYIKLFDYNVKLLADALARAGK